MNPSAEVEAVLEKQKLAGMVAWLVAHPTQGRRLLEKWEAKADKAVLAGELRVLARRAWLDRRAAV